jgi:hypothetical protein
MREGEGRDLTLAKETATKTKICCPSECYGGQNGCSHDGSSLLSGGSRCGDDVARALGPSR